MFLFPLLWGFQFPCGWLLHRSWVLSYLIIAAAAAKSCQSCPTLCDPIDGSPLGSSVPGILQTRTLEWVAISFSKAWKWKVKVKSQSCLTLSDPMDCSLPGSAIHRIFQTRVLEWVAIAFSAHNCWGSTNRVASQVALVVKNLPASARDVRNLAFILGSGRSPGGGHGNPL